MIYLFTIKHAILAGSAIGIITGGQSTRVTSNFASSNFRKSDSSDFRKSKSPLFEKKPSDLEHVKLKTEGDEYKLKESLYVVQS